MCGGNEVEDSYTKDSKEKYGKFGSAFTTDSMFHSNPF